MMRLTFRHENSFCLTCMFNTFFVCLCFDQDLSHEVSCKILHFQPWDGAQNVLDFAAFQILDFWIRDA
jgi:hypothetical protein